jgi:hypothetical protein
VTSENSPSKMAASEKPLVQLVSAEVVVSAASGACAAPSTTKEAPGNVWKVARIVRSGLKSYAQAARSRRVRSALEGERFVGAEAKFAARVSDALGVRRGRTYWRRTPTKGVCSPKVS